MDLYCKKCENYTSTILLQICSTSKLIIKCPRVPSSLGRSKISLASSDHALVFVRRTFLGQKCLCTMIAFLARSCTSGGRMLCFAAAAPLLLTKQPSWAASSKISLRSENGVQYIMVNSLYFLLLINPKKGRIEGACLYVSICHTNFLRARGAAGRV